MTYKEAVRGNDIGYWEELEKHYKSVYERQVEENNAVSIHLQRRLGLEISRETLLMAWSREH